MLVRSNVSDNARSSGINLKALLAELAGGCGAGLLLARGGGLAGAWIGRSGAPGWGDLIGAILGLFLGYLIGVPIGLALVGRLLKQRGSFWLALLGSILGGALVGLLAAPLLRLNENTALLSFAVFFAGLAFATIGYNLRQATRSGSP
jgi:hypothetical protein